MQKSEQTATDPTSTKYHQLAGQLLQSFGEMSSIDELKRHAKLLLKSVHGRPQEFKDQSEEVQLMNLFYAKLLDRLKDFYPTLFKQYEHVADKVQLISQEFDSDQVFYGKLGSLFTTQLAVQGQLQSLFEKSEYKSPDKAKGNNSRRQIRKAQKVREEPEGAPQLDHAYVRFMVKSQSAMQYMLKSKNYPRLELKVPITNCLHNLIGYLQDKWVRKPRTHRILLYPDHEQFLKKLKLPQSSQPLNVYYMMSDLLSAYDYPKNNAICLYYDFQPLEAPEPSCKTAKPTLKKLFEITNSEEEKYSPFNKGIHKLTPEQPEAAHVQSKPPIVSKPDEPYETNMRYQSIQFNTDSLELSLFRRPANSNSMLYGPGNYSNRSLMGFGFIKRQDTVNNPSMMGGNSQNNHLQVLRETIRFVDGQEKQKNQQSFSVATKAQVVGIPVIKRKNQPSG